MRRPAAMRLTPFAAALLAAGCALHHVTPYVPDATNVPQTADAALASTSCFEAGTAPEAAFCADPSLLAAYREEVRALQAGLRTAGLFGRDALLASQRAWLLALPERCHLPPPPAKAGTESAACLRAALDGRRQALLGQPPPVVPSGGAVAQYVALRPAASAAPQPDAALCGVLQRRAATALRQIGSLDPAAMDAEELAGTHGPESGAAGGRRVAVDLYDANVYALFQRRARGLSIDGGAPVITPITLTQLVQARSAANQGGRFSTYASQTGDYGSLDVFRLGGRLLAMAADPWGSTTPASPGEAAHAGVWDLSGGAPVPACLFDTYTRPAEPGAFDDLPAFTRWRGALAQLRDAGTAPVGEALTRDAAQLAADTDFVLLHMPLLAVQGASGDWTAWLRHRHDSVLDVLFAWQAADPARKGVFDAVFASLRPAATELVHAYQTTQGLTGAEATQAAGLAVVELLYQATVTIAPGLGADEDAPRSAAGVRARYPILAVPQ